MTMNLKNIANAYFKAWKAHDFESIRSLLSDDVTFIGALGEASGIDECVNGLQGLTSIMNDIVIQHMWADDSDVITWYELHTIKQISRYLLLIGCMSKMIKSPEFV